MAASIQVGRGDGSTIQVTKPDTTSEEARKKAIAEQIDIGTIVDQTSQWRGFFFTGYVAKNRLPWNVVAHGHLGDSTDLAGACEDAAVLFDDCGFTRIKSGSVTRKLAKKLNLDLASVKSQDVVMTAYYFAVRQRVTAIKGTSVIIGYWGFEDYWRYQGINK